MASRNTLAQRRRRQRAKEIGLKRVERYMNEAEEREVDKLLEKMRAGTWTPSESYIFKDQAI